MATTSQPGPPSPKWRAAVTAAAVVAAVLTVGAVADGLATSGVPAGQAAATGQTDTTGKAGTSGQAGEQELARPDGEDSVSRASSRAPGEASSWWHPQPGETWQLQLTGPVDTQAPARIVVLPLDGTSHETVVALHGAGARVACRVSTGIWDSTSPGAAAYPQPVLGRSVDGYATRRYLDVRQTGVLGPLLEKRLATCADRGFDAVDPDGDDTVIDAGPDGIGFPVTYRDQVAFDSLVAGLAHGHGLAIGLHTSALTDSTAQFVQDLLPLTDFAVIERCAATAGCAPFAAYARHGKPVLHVEYLSDYPGASLTDYATALSAICKATAPLGFSSILMAATSGSADPAWRRTC